MAAVLLGEVCPAVAEAVALCEGSVEQDVLGIPTGLPTDARGTVTVSHCSADHNTTYASEARVECLVTGPHTATLTAVVTQVSPSGPDDLGKRVGFSVYDGGEDNGRSDDREGFSWNGVNLLPDGDTNLPKPP